jgi:hypothetical protein
MLSRISVDLGEKKELKFRDLAESFGVRGFAFLLLVFSSLNLAIFMVPGLSILFGIPMVFLAAQMALGKKTPFLPEFALERKVNGRAMRAGMEKASMLMKGAEKVVKPRFLFMFGAFLDKFNCVLALFMAVLVSIPIPFVNILPTFGVAVLSVGIIQRDGLFVAGAYAIAFWSLMLFKSLGHAANMLFG